MNIKNILVSVSFCICVLLAPAAMAQGGPGSGSTTGGSGTSTSSTSGSTSGGATGSTTCTAATQQISLHIPNESVPPGGVVQMKVMVTEPTPISSGGPRTTIPSGTTVHGIQLFNPTGDVNGVAMVNGSQVTIAYVTSTGAQGTDYPILTMALEVSPSTPLGTQMQFGLDPSSTWILGLLGTATMQPIPPATITVGGSVSITDIVPGGGFLPAGSVVSVEGIGFQPGTQVQVGGFNVSSTTVVNPNEIRIVLAQPTEMSGKKIQVTNPDGSSATYFSYLRGIPLGQSSRSLLSSAIPIFSSVRYSQATFATSSSTTGKQFSGIALQNSNLVPATVTFTLFSSSNTPLGSSVVLLPSGYNMTRETSELAQGAVPPPGSYLTVSSNEPIQVFGFQGDEVAGTVLPFVPLASQP